MVALTLLALAASFAGLAAADLQVIQPSSSIWWVANSQNVFAWTCQESTVTNFTVVMSNSNPAILSGNQAFIAIQPNDQCSRLVTPQQVNFSAGTGYSILLTDIFNQTNVLAQSEQFEIKPFGSAYPATTSVAAPSSTGSGAAGAAGASPSGSGNGKGGATSLKTIGLGFGVALAAGIASLM